MLPHHSACVPSMHYSLSSRPCQPFMLLVLDCQQAGTPLYQHHANITRSRYHTYLPPWQNDANVPPWQPSTNVQPWTRHDNDPHWQSHTNDIPPGANRGYIPVQQYHTSIAHQESNWHENSNPDFDTDQGVQSWLSIDVEVDDIEAQPWLSIDVEVEASEMQPWLSDDSEVEFVEVQIQLSDDTEGDLEVMISFEPPQEEIGIADVTLLPYVFAPDAKLEDCVICMDEMCPEERHEIAKLPCGHLFHGDCIVRWLSGHNTCPICRFKLPDTR